MRAFAPHAQGEGEFAGALDAGQQPAGHGDALLFAEGTRFVQLAGVWLAVPGKHAAGVGPVVFQE